MTHSMPVLLSSILLTLRVGLCVTSRFYTNKARINSFLHCLHCQASFLCLVVIGLKLNQVCVLLHIRIKGEVGTNEHV